MENPKYDKDFYAWALHNAELLRQGKFTEVDTENVAEEIESMGRNNKQALLNRLAIILAHLLKWQFQPSIRSKSWKLTLKEQRLRVQKLLIKNPSLKYQIVENFNDAYQLAIIKALRETGLPETTFSENCLYSLEQCLNSDFFPE